MKHVFVALLLVFSVEGYGQTIYSGLIHTYPVEFVIDQIYYANCDSQKVFGLYMYKKFNEPIPLEGTYTKKVLVLEERGKDNKAAAVISFAHFKQENDSCTGIWVDCVSGKELEVRLKRKYTLDPYTHADTAWQNRELLQTASLKDYFFKILVSKKTGARSQCVKVDGLEIIAKKTAELFQKIDLEAEYSVRFNSVAVADYNFDGLTEFSVFEGSYTGPNTTSIYFLFDPKTNAFFNSGFKGISLEFDAGKKLIYEHNECCGGREITNSEYNVVNNKMVLVEMKCLKYDDVNEDLVKIPCH